MSNNRYENIVLQDKLTEALKSNVNITNYMTLDDSLTETAGMTKRINTYTSTGDVEDVAEGQGNTKQISVSYTSADYKVTTTQGTFLYTDEDEMTDPYLVDAGITDLGKKMTNSLIDKAIAEFEKATLIETYTTTISFATVVDAIAKLNVEDESGLFMLVNPAM
jgi:hypothetical protein